MKKEVLLKKVKKYLRKYYLCDEEDIMSAFSLVLLEQKKKNRDKEKEYSEEDLLELRRRITHYMQRKIKYEDLSLYTRTTQTPTTTTPEEILLLQEEEKAKEKIKRKIYKKAITKIKTKAKKKEEIIKMLLFEGKQLTEISRETGANYNTVRTIYKALISLYQSGEVA